MARSITINPNWEFVGGRLCLDFANTVSGRIRGDEVDHLVDYASLVDWCGRAGLLTRPERQRLLREAREHPRAAAAVYRTAARLRDAIYAVFAAIAEDRKPEPEALEIINTALTDSFANLMVAESGDGFDWQWRDRDAALERVLWPVARSAGELLTADELARLSQCAAGCSWLFLDTSKNHSRRWCVMEYCGNRAKGRRHYARHRVAQAGADSQDL